MTETIFARPTATQSSDPQSNEVTGGIYLYAIARAGIEIPAGLAGIGGSPVYSRTVGEVCAIVNDVVSKRIRPERRNLAAHQEVLRRLMETETTLPLAFGVIADDCEAVQRILSSHQEAFGEQLSRVDHKVEMSLRVSWTVPNIFEYFINRFPELLEARDRMVSQNATQDDKFAVGRLFEQILTRDRESIAERIESALKSVCHELDTSAVRSENEIANFNCLVSRDSLARFDEVIGEVALKFDDEIAFALSGPWAPHHFVEMTISV